MLINKTYKLKRIDKIEKPCGWSTYLSRKDNGYTSEEAIEGLSNHKAETRPSPPKSKRIILSANERAPEGTTLLIDPYKHENDSNSSNVETSFIDSKNTRRVRLVSERDMEYEQQYQSCTVEQINSPKPNKGEFKSAEPELVINEVYSDFED
jgi:hypothetical protein